MTTPATPAASGTSAVPATETAHPDRAAGQDGGRPPRTGGSVAPRRVGGPRRWWDGVLAADPGLGQLQAGWRSLVAITTGLAVGYGMSVALTLPAMLGMMVGGMMGLMSAFAIAENTPLRLTRSILWMPFPYSAVLPLAAWLHDDRALELTLMVVALALTFFLARFGSLALLTGMMLFNSFMVGMMANIPLNLCGKLFVVALVSSAAILAARLLLCCPMPREDLLRTQRAFVVEARRVGDAATAALDPDADHEVAIKRMRRSLRRLNITTVTIDGRLAQPEVAADPHTAELLHQYLFDAELALQGIGQAVQRLTRLPVPQRLREAMVVALVVARDTPLGRADALHPAARLIQQQADDVLADRSASPDEAEAAVLARRVGHLLDSLADSLAHWLDLGWNAPKARAKVPFQPTVALEQNRPAGTGAVARRIAAAQELKGWRRVVPYVRVPLHAAVACAIVCPITDAIDPRRFYWGLVGVMITLFGTNTTPERLRKLAHRMVGTAVGAVVGIWLLHVIGPGHVYPTLLVIVAGLTLGAWGMQRQYAYWVVGLVVALVQLYGMTTPYSGMDHLLAERLLDNGIGILVATACAALIFPLSTRKVAQEADRGYVAALEHLVTQIRERWEDPEAPVRLRGAARGVDAALFQVRSVARPLVRMPIGVRGRGAENRLALLATATAHARALAAAADVDIDLGPRLTGHVERITQTLLDSLRELDRHFSTGEPEGTWVRVSPLVRDLEGELRAPAGPRADRLHIALRELAALDEVLAGYAEGRGLRTVAPAPAPVAAEQVTTPAGAPRTAPPTPRERRTQEVLAAWAAHTRRSAEQKPAGAPDPRATAGAVHPAGPGAPVPAQATGPGTAPAARASDPGRVRHTGGLTTGGPVTVSGSVRCDDHPVDCDAWITVVNARGKRRAGVRAVGGRYRITGLEPGTYTLIAAGSSHAPRAEFLSVPRTEGEMHHDLRLHPASGQ
ncbi:FUSC family protein [Streptomyces sp. NBC_01089]|uniref:FUSC family protein n=1 Tax=Streptomyces sp. NBC_01089 TaxID=2903747 RepID=UPI003870EB23|nr:FUSC family protein [Streptomyces sp. NBC_01089]